MTMKGFCRSRECRGAGSRTGSRSAGAAIHSSRRADTHRAFDESGRILRDNVYGNIDEDVWRRDFTANSLYYNIADFSLWDYVDGAEDIAARTLRLIGDPETRYREDPVRMLRAARFEAKLDFYARPGDGGADRIAGASCWAACRRRGCSTRR